MYLKNGGFFSSFLQQSWIIYSTVSESDNDIKRCIDASNTLILQVYSNADIQSHNLYILYIGDHPMIPSHIIEDSSSGSNPTDDHGSDYYISTYTLKP